MHAKFPSPFPPPPAGIYKKPQGQKNGEKKSLSNRVRLRVAFSMFRERGAPRIAPKSEGLGGGSEEPPVPEGMDKRERERIDY